MDHTNIIDWPFRYMPIFSWSDTFPDYGERMMQIGIDAIHWATMMDT